MGLAREKTNIPCGSRKNQFAASPKKPICKQSRIDCAETGSRRIHSFSRLFKKKVFHFFSHHPKKRQVLDRCLPSSLPSPFRRKGEEICLALTGLLSYAYTMSISTCISLFIQLTTSTKTLSLHTCLLSMMEVFPFLFFFLSTSFTVTFLNEKSVRLALAHISDCSLLTLL